MHVLVTADSLSGSWTYTRELVTGLVTRGVRVTLVSFGEIPLPEQTTWMDHLHGLEYRPTAFRLEWMQEAEDDLPESSAFLAALVREPRVWRGSNRHLRALVVLIGCSRRPYSPVPQLRRRQLSRT